MDVVDGRYKHWGYPQVLDFEPGSTSDDLHFAIASQFSQSLFSQIFSMPFLQFNDLATILAVVVLPTPLIPVNK